MKSDAPFNGIAGLLALWVLLTLAGAANSQGIRGWSARTKVGPDADVPGWFFNLGITGARAKVPDDELTCLEVMHVFKGTPASKKLRVGDRIVGVGGKKFTTAHRFGYGVDKFGYDGPVKDFGMALEKCQGSKKLEGKLTVRVRRKKKLKTVTLKLPRRYGRFGKTYPYECEKSERILAELRKWLGERQKKNGFWSGGRPHLDTFAMLALLSTPKQRYRREVDRAARAFADSTSARDESPGHLCWKYTLYGIALSEYYLLTKQKWVLDELKQIDRWLRSAQAPRGGWGHRQWAEGGKNGYGPICAITAQAQLAWSLMARCGIRIDRKRYQQAHEFIARGTNRIGYVWYKDGVGGKTYADMGRTGVSALANALSPAGNSKWRDLARRNARCIGENWNTFSDTHGSPILGLVWTALGAATHRPSFRKLMDNNRWYFALSQCPDKTFIYQPNRDGNAQDWSSAPRLSATAATALILSLRERRLAITGKARKGGQ